MTGSWNLSSQSHIEGFNWKICCPLLLQQARDQGALRYIGVHMSESRFQKYLQNKF